MNFNVYIEADLGKEVAFLAKKLGRSRNSIIREALSAWVIDHCSSSWPPSIQRHRGDSRFPRLEDYRSELLQPKDEDMF